MLVGETSQGRGSEEREEALIHLFRYTKQLNLNGYIGAKRKGRVLQIMGNLPFELAELATTPWQRQWKRFWSFLVFVS